MKYIYLYIQLPPNGTHIVINRTKNEKTSIMAGATAAIDLIPQFIVVCLQFSSKQKVFKRIKVIKCHAPENTITTVYNGVVWCSRINETIRIMN